MRRIGRWFAGLRDTEPARWAELARALLVLGVGAGWVTIDEDTINWIVTGVGMLASTLLSRWVRSSVYSKRTLDRLLTRRTPRPVPRRSPLLLRDDQPPAPPPAPPREPPREPPSAPSPA